MRASPARGPDLLFRRVTFSSLLTRWPGRSLVVALVLLALLLLVLVPLLSFVFAAAVGAGAYALLGRQSKAGPGRLRPTNSDPRLQSLFFDLSALALFGGGLALLGSTLEWSAHAAMPLGLGAALVLVARMA